MITDVESGSMVAWMKSLRPWQKRLVAAYDASVKQSFMIVACPGAGKTRGAAFLALKLLKSQTIDRIVVVCPSVTLKAQWSNALVQFGIRIDPDPSNGARHLFNQRNYQHGYAVTYASVSKTDEGGRHRTSCENTRTLVIFDEVHHSAEGRSWGDGVSDAFKSAARVICLSGTPYRTDNNRMAFVDYVDVGNNIYEAQADIVYGYGHALGDRPSPVRRSRFLHYDSELKWQELGEDDLALFKATSRSELLSQIQKEDESKAFKAVLKADGEWAKGLLDRGIEELAVARGDDGPEDPKSGGLVLAVDQRQARLIADYLKTKTKTPVTLVISDLPDSEERIKAFRKSTDEWIVAVRKVSEGVDIPRLRVLVYLTNVRTKMFFEQGIGRVIRTLGIHDDRPAVVILPALPVLMTLTAGIEQEQIDAVPAILDDEPERRGDAGGERGSGAAAGIADEVNSAIAGFPFLHSIIFGGQTFSPAQTAVQLKKLGIADGDLPAIQRFLDVLANNPQGLDLAAISDSAAPSQRRGAEDALFMQPDFADFEAVLRSEIKDIVGQICRRKNNGRTGTSKEYSAINAELNRLAGIQSRAKGSTQRTEAELKLVHYQARKMARAVGVKKTWPER